MAVSTDPIGHLTSYFLFWDFWEADVILPNCKVQQLACMLSTQRPAQWSTLFSQTNHWVDGEVCVTLPRKAWTHDALNEDSKLSEAI